jgi:hypothetical protein
MMYFKRVCLLLIIIFCAVLLGAGILVIVDRYNSVITVDPDAVKPIALNPIEEKPLVSKPVEQIPIEAKPVEDWRAIEKRNQEQRNKEAEQYLKSMGNPDITIKSYQATNTNKQTIQNRIKEIDAAIAKLQKSIDMSKSRYTIDNIPVSDGQQITIVKEKPKRQPLKGPDGYYPANFFDKPDTRPNQIEQLQAEKESLLKQIK